MRIVLLVSHIVAGSAALVLGIAALSLAKGSTGHRLAGRAFVAAGRIVIGSALIASFWAMLDIDSFASSGTALRADFDEFREPLRLLMALLAVLGALSAIDLESGISTIRKQAPRAQRPLGAVALATGLMSLVLGVIGVLGVNGSIGGAGLLAWVAVALGTTGVVDGIKNARQLTVWEQSTVGHLQGMIGAFGGFFAAFTLFGAGRLFRFGVFDGNPVALFPVFVVVGGAQLLARWWVRRLATAPLQESALQQGSSRHL